MEPTPRRQPLSFFSLPSKPSRPDMDIASITFPCNLFFYGSLQDDEALGYAANLERKPTLRPATIKQWKQRSWSRYPVLVPNSYPAAADELVKGVAWKCTSVQQLSDIQRLESRIYNLSPCSITLDTGETLVNGYTFVWAYDSADESLQDAAFDLETYPGNDKHAWITDRWDEEGRLKRPELAAPSGHGVLGDEYGEC